MEVGGRVVAERGEIGGLHHVEHLDERRTARARRRHRDDGVATVGADHGFPREGPVAPQVLLVDDAAPAPHLVGNQPGHATFVEALRSPARQSAAGRRRGRAGRNGRRARSTARRAGRSAGSRGTGTADPRPREARPPGTDPPRTPPRQAGWPARAPSVCPACRALPARAAGRRRRRGRPTTGAPCGGGRASPGPCRPGTCRGSRDGAPSRGSRWRRCGRSHRG